MIRKMKRYPLSRDAGKVCSGKSKWGGEEAAQWFLARLRAEEPGSLSSTVRPYRCSECKRWHIGHGQ